MKDIAVFGAGGFGREVACMIKRINKVKKEWNFIGFFDDNDSLIGSENDYGKVLGGMPMLNAWKTPLSIAVGLGSPNAVNKVVDNITNVNIDFPNLLDPTVLVIDNENYKIGKGNIFASNCIISIAVNVGDFNSFNNNTVLGHDDIIGNFNSFMPNVNISGGVKIGNNNFFGVKSTILQYLKVGNNVKIGANSVMIRSAKDGFLYIGNPAKKMEI